MFVTCIKGIFYESLQKDVILGSTEVQLNCGHSCDTCKSKKASKH